MVRGASPLGGGTGKALFDQNAVDFDMTFVGQASITCGNAAPATPTNTVQANTPTATNTPAATATPTNTVIPATATARAAATQTAQNNFGGANTATPTPGGETATPAATDTPSSGGGSPVPTTPGGGQGAGITGPNTGTGGAQQGGNGLPAGWLIIGGIMLALTGGGLYVRSRKVQ